MEEDQMSKEEQDLLNELFPEEEVESREKKRKYQTTAVRSRTFKRQKRTNDIAITENRESTAEKNIKISTSSKKKTKKTKMDKSLEEIEQGEKLRRDVLKCVGERRYNLILIDPPWQYSNKSNQGAAELQYNTLSSPILQHLPLQEISDTPCALLVWTTGVKMPEAIQLIKSWGFEYVSILLVWAKTTRTGRLSIGCGYYTRSSSEYLLLAKRGNCHQLCKKNGTGEGIPSILIDRDYEILLEAENIGHSIKPVAVFDIIKKLFGDIPRLEMFARCRRVGWDAFGNEVDKNQDIQYVLHRVDSTKTKTKNKEE